MVPTFEVRVSRDFDKALDRLKKAGRRDMVRRILTALRELEDDPGRSRPGADIRRLKGHGPDMFRLRVGTYRVIYEVDPDERVVYVTLLATREGAYR